MNKKIETPSLQILRKSLVASENPQFLSKVGDPQFPQKILNTFHSKFSPGIPNFPIPKKIVIFHLVKMLAVISVSHYGEILKSNSVSIFSFQKIQAFYSFLYLEGGIFGHKKLKKKKKTTISYHIRALYIFLFKNIRNPTSTPGTMLWTSTRAQKSMFFVFQRLIISNVITQ